MTDHGQNSSAYGKNVTIAVPIVFGGLATLVYSLRLYARRFVNARYGIDDLLMGIGLILSWAAIGVIVWTGFNGAGQSVDTLPKPERQRFALGSWLLQKFYPTSLAFVKCSIIVFMQRIFHAKRKFLIFSNALMVFVCLWALAALLTNTLECLPVQYYWNKTIKGGHCIANPNRFFITMGSIDLGIDVAILILPMPIIWKLQMEYRRKIALTFIFSLGALVCVFSLMRLIEFRAYTLENLALSSVLEAVFTNLEISVAIICGCLPPLQPLFRSIIPNMTRHNTSNSDSKFPTSTAKSGKPSLFKRKADPYEEEGFERIVDGKGTRNIYTEPDESDHALEMGGIGVQTDLKQTTGSRMPQHEPGVTSTAWPM